MAYRSDLISKRDVSLIRICEHRWHTAGIQRARGRGTRGGLTRLLGVSRGSIAAETGADSPFREARLLILGSEKGGTFKPYTCQSQAGQ